MEVRKAGRQSGRVAFAGLRPFHSSLIRPAADKLGARLADLEFKVPVIWSSITLTGTGIGPDAHRGTPWCVRPITGTLGRDDPEKRLPKGVTTVCGVRSWQGARRTHQALRRKASTALLADAASVEANLGLEEYHAERTDCLGDRRTRGIGRAIALELGRQGAAVVGTATSEDGAERISAYLGGGRRQGEVSSSGARRGPGEAAIATIEKEFGAVGILVNNAGITRDNLAMRMKDDGGDAVIDTNLKAVFRLSKAVMRGHGEGRRGASSTSPRWSDTPAIPVSQLLRGQAGVAGMTRSLPASWAVATSP